MEFLGQPQPLRCNVPAVFLVPGGPVVQPEQAESQDTAIEESAMARKLLSLSGSTVKGESTSATSSAATEVRRRGIAPDAEESMPGCGGRLAGQRAARSAISTSAGSAAELLPDLP